MRKSLEHCKHVMAVPCNQAKSRLLAMPNKPQQVTSERQHDLPQMMIMKWMVPSAAAHASSVHTVAWGLG